MWFIKQRRGDANRRSNALACLFLHPQERGQLERRFAENRRGCPGALAAVTLLLCP